MTGSINFRKMNGLGNDFVMLDARAHPLALKAAQIAAIADRNRGIGCDQVIALEPSDFADVFMRDLVSSPNQTIASGYSRFDLPLTGEAERRMRTWLNEHPQHRHGTVAYSLEEFGLDRDEVCEAFREYTQRFDLRLDD